MKTLQELAETYERLAADAEAVADWIMARAAREGTAQRGLREAAALTPCGTGFWGGSIEQILQANEESLPTAS
jgi:hypothetical protein